MVANESPFNVVYGNPIVYLVLSSESAFINVNRCTKTYDIGSRTKGKSRAAESADDLMLAVVKSGAGSW